jgi:hypothetical protein
MQLKRYVFLFMAALAASLMLLRPAWAAESPATEQNQTPLKNDQPAAVPASGQTGAANAHPALAHFPELVYSFQPVVEGTEVSHEFIVQNKGLAELEITSVKTG